MAISDPYGVLCSHAGCGNFGLPRRACRTVAILLGMIGLLGQIPTARAHSAAGDSTPDPAVESGAPDGGGHLRSFPGSIQAVSDDPNATGWHIARRNLSDAELAAPIDFRISLKMRDLAGLQARILGGQHVSQAEMEAEYLPDKSAYDNLVTWLTANGFAITLVDRNHTTVYARAPASRIAGILGTTFARVSRNREEFTSAITAPSLPESLAGQVLSISGLQTHRRLTRTPLTHVQPQLFTGGTYPPYATPVDIQAAYDFPANLDGTGQTIALYEDALPVDGRIHLLLESHWFESVRQPGDHRAPGPEPAA